MALCKTRGNLKVRRFVQYEGKLMTDVMPPSAVPRVWAVGALCRAIADALDARFNPIRVSGEIGGFTRAASGHCYFTLKDESGQLRCAMFRRAATSLDFNPKEGDHVEITARLSVYESRGELQLVVEAMSRAGQGTLLEEFFKLKLRLEHEGLFASDRKRPLKEYPRGIGLVTSLGAAALHDVVSALQRRVPHIPVVLVPSAVQGEGAPTELVGALESLYRYVLAAQPGVPALDVILLVRGGGSMEDLWSFNDERLARTIARSPIPVICGVGHETDFSIADFVADVRAPTPTAAAEMASSPGQLFAEKILTTSRRLNDGLQRFLDRQSQRLDHSAMRIGRPSDLVQMQRIRWVSAEQRFRACPHAVIQHKKTVGQDVSNGLVSVVAQLLVRESSRVETLALKLQLLDPSLVLRRGYARLLSTDGQTLSSVKQAHAGQSIQATLADGVVDLEVTGRRLN